MDSDETPLSFGSPDPRPDVRDSDAPSIWLRPASKRPRRPEPLTLERIVLAAVQHLDAHGSEGLTMRRLAQDLGVTATALYWHVATKEDVLDLALDQVFGEVALPDPSNEVGEDIRTLMLGWRAAMLRHPWSPVLLGRPLLGPHVLARTEFLQSALARAGLTGIQLATATHLIASFVIGAAVTQASWMRVHDATTRTKAQEHVTRSAELYPTLNSSRHFDAQHWPDDELFRSGLDQVLTALLSSAADRDPGPMPA